MVLHFRMCNCAPLFSVRFLEVYFLNYIYHTTNNLSLHYYIYLQHLWLQDNRLEDDEISPFHRQQPWLLGRWDPLSLPPPRCLRRLSRGKLRDPSHL